MKIFSYTVLLLFFSIATFAQKIIKSDLKKLQISEDTLKKPALQIVQGNQALERLKADSVFTRLLVKSLKTSNSFYYPFDSLQTISKLYSPDSTFRIFTWQLVIDDAICRQHGAIQMRTPDGSLKLYPLIDKSDITKNYSDSIGNNFGWMGAVYYRIILNIYSGKKIYTLLGYDEHGILSSRKLIEILTFENNEPVFGRRCFSVPNDKLIPKTPARYVMEFKKDAGPRLTYDEDLQMIIMEHLVSESNEPNKKFTLVGDGDYEGFKWTNGKWIYISKVFNEVTPEGQPPVPDPVKEDKRMDPSKYNQAVPENTRSPE